jgi:antitoxin (DNA-binding transcriptional repressor) of toxin-antitoxin stability system
MSQLPVEEAPGVSDAAHEAASGQVVYITEHGERLAAIVPAEYAAALEAMNPEQAAELLEDLADGADVREALAELTAGAEPVPAEQVWAEFGIDQ